MRFLRSPSSMGSRNPARRRSRWRWWLLRLFGCLLVLFAMVAAATLVLIHSLDRPWVKGKLQGLARASAGLEVDYRAARVDLFSGAEVDGLVVGSPPEFRSLAPDLVRIGRIDATWSIGALFGGQAPALKKLSVSEVALTVVVDERGRTSFHARRQRQST